MAKSSTRKNTKRSKSKMPRARKSSGSSPLSQEQCLRFLAQDKSGAAKLINPLTGKSIKRGLAKYQELVTRCSAWSQEKAQPHADSQPDPQPEPHDMDKLVQENISLKKEVERLEREISSYQKNIGDITKENSQLKTNIEDLEKTIDDMRTKTQTSQEMLAKENSELRSRIGDLEKELESIARSQSQEQSQQTQAAETVERLRQENESLKEKYSSLKTEFKEMRDMLMEEIDELKKSKVSSPNPPPPPPPPPPKSSPKPGFMGDIGACLKHDSEEACNAHDDCQWDGKIKKCKRSPVKKSGKKAPPPSPKPAPEMAPKPDFIGDIGRCLKHEDQETCNADKSCSWNADTKECRKMMKKPSQKSEGKKPSNTGKEEVAHRGSLCKEVHECE
jgi:uncharacterized coiled-coil DUF342 family protein